MSVDCFKMSVTRLNYSAMTEEQKEPTLRVTHTEGFVRGDFLSNDLSPEISCLINYCDNLLQMRFFLKGLLY